MNISESEKKIILIGGNANAGKDSLCKCFMEISNKKIERFAFADSLKDDLKDFIIDKFGLNIFEIDTPTKNKVRPLLVGYGEAQKLFDPMRWVNIAKEKILRSDCEIAIISDWRFDIELQIASECPRNAISIFLDRNIVLDGKSVSLPPANATEMENQDKIFSLAQKHFSWSNLKTHEERTKWLEKELEKSENKDIVNFLL